VTPRSAALVAALVVAGLLGGCTSAGQSDEGSRRTLTVLAAASLTESFTDLADDFEQEHRGVEVRLAFGSSATLASQASEGAPGDVLATADERTMRTAVAAEATAEDPTTFATNRLVLVVPAGNPAGVRDFSDLDRSDVGYVACVESAPCGALAREVLEREGVAGRPRSLEVDVKAVLTKVSLDEADAGLVYASDAVTADDAVTEVASPARPATTSYLAAPLGGADEPALARAWVTFLVTPAAQDVLADAGFSPPTPEPAP
jgi:molybdate transport system substrate-binding protein